MQNITIGLGPRLETVGSFVPAGARLGDIGTDHAYLPIALYEKGMIVKAVAVDVHKGPYESAKEAVGSRQLESVIDVRFGDGLQPVLPGEVDTLTLAGMGGRTMLEILNARPEVANLVSCLVLQPQGAEASVRHSLLDTGWLMQDECLVEEDGRVYVVMVYTRQNGKTKTELEERVALWVERLWPKFNNSLESASANDDIFLERMDKANFAALAASLVWYLGPLVLDKPSANLFVLLDDYIDLRRKRTEQMQLAKSREVQEKIAQDLRETLLAEGMKKWLSVLI